MKKVPKQNKKRITDFFEKIDWMCELNNFERNIEIIKNQPKEHPQLAAEIIPDMTYREITIELYPQFFKLSLDLQRKALLHELVHTLLQNTKSFAMDLIAGSAHSEADIKNENEIAVSKITHLLDCLLLGQLRYARKAYKEYLKK